MATKRSPMSISAPSALTLKGGLASTGQSPYEAAQGDPEAAKVLDQWTREPAERVAGSIGQQEPQGHAAEPAAAPVVPSVPETAAAAPAPAVAPSEPASVEVQPEDEDEVQPLPVTRKAKPWAEKEKELRGKNGARTGHHVKIDSEIFAKAWWVKGSTPGMTWESFFDEALERFTNKKLREMGYRP